MKIEIELNNYITEEDKKEIVLDVFRDRINKAFGGDEYSNSGKEADRLMKNAISYWLTNEIEKVMTNEMKETIKNKAVEAIESKNYSFEIFQKPDTWDRSEFSAYKIIQDVIKNKREIIEEWAEKELVNLLTPPTQSE